MVTSAKKRGDAAGWRTPAAFCGAVALLAVATIGQDSHFWALVMIIVPALALAASRLSSGRLQLTTRDPERFPLWPALLLPLGIGIRGLWDFSTFNGGYVYLALLLLTEALAVLVLLRYPRLRQRLASPSRGRRRSKLRDEPSAVLTATLRALGPASLPVILLSVLVYGEIIGLNGLLDSSEPSLRAVEVTEKWQATHRGRRGPPTEHFFIRTSTANFTYRHRYEVPVSLYQQLSVGKPVCFLTHAGFLHVRWYQLTPCPQVNASDRRTETRSVMTVAQPEAMAARVAALT